MPPDSPLWIGSELKLATSVAVKGAASAAGERNVVVRGFWKTVVVHECGRCVESVRAPVEQPFVLAYASGEDADPDGEARAFDECSGALSLDDALREEVLLAVPRYFVPGEDGDGRCTRCGVCTARFRHPQELPEPGADPRWAALRALQAE